MKYNKMIKGLILLVLLVCLLGCHNQTDGGRQEQFPQKSIETTPPNYEANGSGGADSAEDSTSSFPDETDFYKGDGGDSFENKNGKEVQSIPKAKETKNTTKENKSKSSGISNFISIVSLLMSGYCFYAVTNMKKEKAYMSKIRQQQMHPHRNIHNSSNYLSKDEEAYAWITNKVESLISHAKKTNESINTLRTDFEALKSKNTNNLSYSTMYKKQPDDKPLQSNVNSMNINARQQMFNNIIEEYNYYINSGTGLPSKFEKLSFQAKNNQLLPKYEGEALLYIFTGDGPNASGDKLHYIFPSKRIYERTIQRFVCDAFEIVGNGDNVRLETPCIARKMSTNYEIIRKGKVILE